MLCSTFIKLCIIDSSTLGTKIRQFLYMVKFTTDVRTFGMSFHTNNLMKFYQKNISVHEIYADTSYYIVLYTIAILCALKKLFLCIFAIAF